MYSLVPAIVSMMIFWVLRPKSASLIRGKGLPMTYLDFRSIFYGFRSRCVIRWLCNYCTPLLIWRIHSNAYFYPILLSLHKLSASLKLLILIPKWSTWAILGDIPDSLLLFNDIEYFKDILVIDFSELLVDVFLFDDII